MQVAEHLATTTREGDKYNAPFNEFKFGGLCDHEVLRVLNPIVSHVPLEVAFNCSTSSFPLCSPSVCIGDEELVRVLVNVAATLGTPLTAYIVSQLTQLLQRLRVIFEVRFSVFVRAVLSASGGCGNQCAYFSGRRADVLPAHDRLPHAALHEAL